MSVQEIEHLDWNARMRIMMGSAYCLQYMHDLNPPVTVTHFRSEDIFLTDDYAAKVCSLCSASFIFSFVKFLPLSYKIHSLYRLQILASGQTSYPLLNQETTKLKIPLFLQLPIQRQMSTPSESCC